MLPCRLRSKLARAALCLSTLAAIATCPAGIAAHAEMRVVVTMKPIHALVAGVMAGIGEPYLIVKGAASPHTYALKPSDAAALQSADMVFRVGPSFERFLTAALESGSRRAEVISLGDALGARELPYRTGAAWGTHTADGGHGHGGHGHDHGAGIDPHIWLDPEIAIAIVAEAAQALGLAEPRRLLAYAKNAVEMTARIKSMQSEIQATLTPVRGRPFLVYHDAFQYFERAFGVTAAGAIALGESRTPGAKRIQALRARIARSVSVV